MAPHFSDNAMLGLVSTAGRLRRLALTCSSINVFASAVWRAHIGNGQSMCILPQNSTARDRERERDYQDTPNSYFQVEKTVLYIYN